MNLYMHLLSYEVDPGTFIMRLPVKRDDQMGHVYLICTEVVSDMAKELESSDLYMNIRVVDFYYTGMPLLGSFSSLCYYKFGKMVDFLYNQAIKDGSRQLKSTLFNDEIWNYYEIVEAAAPHIFEPEIKEENSNDNNIVDIDFKKNSDKKE